MSDPVKPAAGQVWAYPGDDEDVVLVTPDNNAWWRGWILRKRLIGRVHPPSRVFIRWATTAECRAAGLDPAVVLPKPDPRRVVGAVVRVSSAQQYAVVAEQEPSQAVIESPSVRVCKCDSDTFVRWMTEAECRRHGIPYVARGADGEPVPTRPEWVRVTDSCRGVGAPEVRRVKRWEGEWPVVDCYSGGVRAGSLTLTSNWKWEPCDPPTPTLDRIVALSSDLASVRAERDAALAQVEALRIGVAAAEREVAVYRREFNVGDLRREIAGLKKQRDEATKRAEAAEAVIARHACPSIWPVPPQLTREDRAWMDAAQRRDAYYDGSPLCRDTAKAAIAARTGNGGGA